MVCAAFPSTGAVDRGGPAAAGGGRSGYQGGASARPVSSREGEVHVSVEPGKGARPKMPIGGFRWLVLMQKVVALI